MYIMSIVFGLIIVISSIFLIRRELNRTIVKREQLLEHSRIYKEEDLFMLLENLQISIDEMNNAFYEIASDLEEKYSQHEKEIQIIEEQLNLIMKAPKAQGDPPQNIKNDLDHIRTHKDNMDKIKMSEAQNLISIHEVERENEIEPSLRDRIISLRSEGVPLKTIARDLNIGIGELQLLIQIPDVNKKI